MIQYDAAFAGKPSAVEPVNAMADPDGLWRAAA